MKKILLILAMMMFAGCEHSNEPEQTYYCSINDITYQTEDTYNKNCFIFNWHDCPADDYEKGYTKCKCTERDCWLIESSSSSGIAYSSSSVRTNDYVYSSSSVKSYWALEVGYVCNGYNIDVVINDPSRAVESYYAMYQICGDRSTQTYECVDTETAAAALTRLFNQTTATEVVNRSKYYGATFGFYNAVDGYMRYVYFELCYDGKALLKSH